MLKSLMMVYFKRWVLTLSYRTQCRYDGARQRPKLLHIDIQCEGPRVLQEAGLVVVVVYGTGDMETSDNGLNYSWSSQGQGWL